MEEIQWQEPPPAHGGGPGKKWAKVAEQLRQRPGEWALVTRGNAAIANDIRHGRTTAWRPAGHFEATTRATGERNKADIYARYVGGEPA